MRIVCISDTHLAEPELPEGDILIHSGDLTYRGRPHEIQQQLEWLSKNRKKYNYVIVTPGNHDFGFEQSYLKYKNLFEDEGIIVLNEEETVLDGIKFYGSPITPFFHSWAFNRYSEHIKDHWDIIPSDINVLITHGPPVNILDGVPEEKRVLLGLDEHFRSKYKKEITFRHVGCPSLLDRIKELPNLKLHVFGHIHEAYGQEEHFGVKFVNPSIMDGNYNPVNKPIIVEI